MTNTKTIKNIAYYDCAYSLLEQETILLLGEEDHEFLRFLRTFDAFESFAYFCLDGEVYVTDSCNGDVLQVCSPEELLQGARDYYDTF